MDPEVQARIRALKKRLGVVPNATFVRLPKATRSRALSSKTMNGRIEDLAAVTMPRSANKRVGIPRSKVTGVSAGSNVHGASYEDAVAPTHKSIPSNK